MRFVASSIPELALMVNMQFRPWLFGTCTSIMHRGGAQQQERRFTSHRLVCVRRLIRWLMDVFH